jgi:hypothetical protein
MTNEGEGEALGEGELCPIDGIKGQKGLCILCAFAVNAFLTAETQRITREKTFAFSAPLRLKQSQPQRRRRITREKNLRALCAFAVKTISTAETQSITREKNLCGECIFNRVYILGFSFVMLTPLVNVSFIFSKLFTGCFFDAKSLRYLAVKSSRRILRPPPGELCQIDGSKGQ